MEVTTIDETDPFDEAFLEEWLWASGGPKSVETKREELEWQIEEMYDSLFPGETPVISPFSLFMLERFRNCKELAAMSPKEKEDAAARAILKRRAAIEKRLGLVP